MAIWTHVAGQTTAEAPSPLAFVAAILHGVGTYYPEGGLGAVPKALEAAAIEAGVEFQYGTTVTAIRSDRGRARGVVTASGAILEADAVVSNRNGVGTYLGLAPDAVPAEARRRLERLPLQSPGVCAYLAVRGDPAPPYLRFRLPGGGELCRLLVTPAAILPGLRRDGWAPARLIAPMAYADAQRLGPAGQREYLERVLAEPWWREHVGEARVLDARTPADWGAACHLHRESMNPVMTARFMRAGRLAHRSPYVERLYLAGSATHPGQWVSFCAISGVLAADRAAGGPRLMLLATTTETAPGGRRLRVARLGSGPPLVLLHGYPDNLQIWSELAPRLADRFTVIAPDWPGMGYSEAWPGGATPFHMADRLLALLDAWGLDRVSLAGLDMGGQPALCFAARHPERVGHLVVMNSLVQWDEATSWEIRVLRRFGWNRLILRRLPRAVFRRAERTFLPRGVSLSPELRADLWDSFRRPEVRAFIAKMCAGYQGTFLASPSCTGPSASRH